MATENAEAEISEESLEGARRGGDIFVEIPESMTNQIFRHGCIPSKKTIDGSNSSGTRGSRPYHRDSRTHTPEGSVIIHREDVDPYPNSCDTFIHPPYGSNQQYRGEYEVDYQARVRLGEIGDGATKCAFCAILYCGVQGQRDLWIGKWAKFQWISSHMDYDPVRADEEEPWIDVFRDELESDKEIDEDGLALDITFPKDQTCLTVCLVFLGQREGTPENGPNQLGTNEEIEPRKTPNFRDPRRTLAEFEYYTVPGSPSPWAAFAAATHIRPNVFGNNCLKEISDWIEECVFDHPACVDNAWMTKSEADDGLPRRLLRLRDCHEDPPHVKLEEITDSEERYRYVALSHVWANTEPYKSLRGNYSDHMARVPWQHLSRPLQEAVAVALVLEYEYIWIDSLCIVQDDPADKEKELPRMSLIYGQADVVFAVHGSDLGCKKVASLAIENSNHTDDAPVYCRLKMDHSNLFSAPRDPSSWFGRAWCMQERIFAPRILHFGGSWEELFFECNTLIRCECGALNKDRRQRQLTLKEEITEALASVEEEDIEPTEFRNDLWRVYITACENYTPRGVSSPADTLSAISSLMHRFVPHLGKYHAGLWEHNLLISLQWEACMTRLCTRHEDYVAPSFSWASRSGAVIWYFETENLPMPETHDFATIVDVSCHLAGSDPCGRVASGYMTLRGYVTDMKIEDKSPWLPDGRLEMTKEGVESCFVTLDSKEDLERVQVGMIVKCLDIMRDKEGYHGNYVSGLILLPVDSQDGHYCRIGFSTMSEKHFKDSVLENVTIV